MPRERVRKKRYAKVSMGERSGVGKRVIRSF
jgi:hypothetical protein